MNLPSSFRFLILFSAALFMRPTGVDAAPVPFHLQGTVAASKVLTHTLFPQTNQTAFLESTAISSFKYTKPVLARDAEGNVYIGNRDIVTKLSPAGVPLWRSDHRRVDSVSGQTTTYTERWSHVPLASGVFNYNVLNTANAFGTTSASQVVNTIEITQILIDNDDTTDADDTTNTSIFIIARELSGPADTLRTYVAKLSSNGRFLWRQVTTTPLAGGADSYIGTEYIHALYRENTDTLQIVESSGFAGNAGSKPGTRFVQINGTSGTRGLPLAFGTVGSPMVTNTKLFSVFKMIPLSAGRIAWLAAANDTLVTAGTFQDVNNFRVEIFNPANGKKEDSLQFPRDYGTLYQDGWLRREVTDIGVTDAGQVYVNSLLSTYHDEPPYYNNQTSLQAWDTSRNGSGAPLLLSENPAWTVNPPGSDWASDIRISGNHITLVGNAPSNPAEVTGWNVIRLGKNGTKAPTHLWSRVLPDNFGPYHRVASNIHDWDADAHGNVYLLSRFTESDNNLNILFEPRLTYVKYSAQGHLQFIKPLDAFKSDGPASLLLDPSNLENSASRQYHKALLVRNENPANAADKLNHTWAYVDLEQENTVAAEGFAFNDVRKRDLDLFEGKFVNASVVGTSNSTQPLSIGDIRFNISTTTPAWTIQAKADLPQGIFLSVYPSDDAVTGQISGPIELPFGDYPVKLTAQGPHGSTSRTFTIRHLPEKAEFSTVPVGSLVARGSSFRLSAVVGNASIAGDLEYQWQRKIGSKWTDVKGATKPSYRFTKLTITADYRLAVSNLAGTSHSPSARITVDTEAPFISKPSKPAALTTTTANTTVSGSIFDNLRPGSLQYQVKSGDGEFDGYQKADLGAGTNVRAYQFSIPTPKAGKYTVRFLAKDASGNKRVESYVITRK